MWKEGGISIHVVVQLYNPSPAGYTIHFIAPSLTFLYLLPRSAPLPRGDVHLFASQPFVPPPGLGPVALNVVTQQLLLFSPEQDRFLCVVAQILAIV